jgi:imidazolonepropionase-like amidohydrolase
MLTGMAIEAASADELLEAAMRQLDVGADLVKLYLDGPDLDTPPWSPDEVSRVVRAVHARGATVAAHATRAANVALAAEAAVDTVEHGTEIEEPVARTMAAAGVTLVTTLSVYRSFRTFSRTTTLPRFVDEGRARELYESALASAAAAQRAGVRIAAGSDCGGGSVRPGHLAWEVESLVEAGLEPWQALGAATWQGGEVLGEPSAGRLQAGGPADFVLVHGDPTTDASSLWRVWEVVCAAPA